MLALQSHLTPRLDLSEAATGEAYGVYAKWRAAGPLWRAGHGMFAIPRYREVSSLLRDSRLGPFKFSEAGAGALEGNSACILLDGSLVAMQGAAHARLRKLVAQAVMRRLGAPLQARIDALCAEMLAPLRRSGTFEAVSALAYPLPLIVLSELFGIPESDRDGVGREVLKLSKMFSPTVQGADSAAADLAVRSLRRYFASLVNSRLHVPTEDLVSELSCASADNAQAQADVVGQLIFLLFAGLETSINLIAAGCAALARNPAEADKMRDDAFDPTCAVNEILRYDSPTQITARTVLEPIEMEGIRIRRGRVVLLLLGSANHDQTQFQHPERLMVERTPNPHLAFGAGLHGCIGASLARMEAGILFHRMVRMFRIIEPVDDIVRVASVTPRVYLKVPLRVRGNVGEW